jgi:hypothetical protein
LLPYASSSRSAADRATAAVIEREEDDTTAELSFQSP